MHRLAAALVLALAAAAAPAQERTSRLVVPVPAGGSFDILARALVPHIAAPGETWVVENRPGAETMIGSEHVARSPADGRTVLMAGVTLTLVPLLRKVPFGPDDLKPVVQIAASDYAIVVPAQSPFQSLADLASGTTPLNCGAPPGPMGVGCAQVGPRVGRPVTSIPYPGVAPAVTAALGGHIDILIVTVDVVAKLVEGGKLRVLAVTAPHPALKAPLLAQAWPGFVMEGFIGLFVPAGTPDADVRRLNAAVNRALTDAAFATLLRDGGNTPVGGAPEDFASRVQRVRAHYRDVLPGLGLGLEARPQ